MSGWKMSGDGNYLSTPSKVPAKLNRTGSAVGDFALERSPISSTARSTQYFVSTAPDQYQVRKQEGLQTDIGSSTSENKRGSVFAVEGRCMQLHPSAWKRRTDGWNVPSVTLSDYAGFLVFGEPLRPVLRISPLCQGRCLAKLELMSSLM
jgi:hypothetical protein